MSSNKLGLLGYTKKEQYGEIRAIYLYDFKRYGDGCWSGGYIGNFELHSHFNSCFLDKVDTKGHILGKFVISNECNVWEDIETYLDDVPENISKNWWRLKDLFKQFYVLQEAAEVFQYGVNISGNDRNPAELNPNMAEALNRHLETVIIPEIRAIMSA